jgi:hypothetical protein
MAVLTDRAGRNVPIFVDYYEYHSIATEDYSPTEDPSLTAEEIGLIESVGFLVMPNADGALYGITLYDFKNNNDSVTGLVPEPFPGLASTWIECRFVKVFATDDATYKSIATAITVGITV